MFVESKVICPKSFIGGAKVALLYPMTSCEGAAFPANTAFPFGATVIPTLLNTPDVWVQQTTLVEKFCVTSEGLLVVMVSWGAQFRPNC